MAHYDLRSTLIETDGHYGSTITILTRPTRDAAIAALNEYLHAARGARIERVAPEAALLWIRERGDWARPGIALQVARCDSLDHTDDTSPLEAAIAAAMKE